MFPHIVLFRVREAGPLIIGREIQLVQRIYQICLDSNILQLTVFVYVDCIVMLGVRERRRVCISESRARSMSYPFKPTARHLLLPSAVWPAGASSISSSSK